MLAHRTKQEERPDRPQRPSLLVFTLGPEAEVRRRRLLPAPLGDRETAFHRACLEEALAAGRAAGCRLEVASPNGSRLDALPPDATGVGQRGACFGERFANAFDGALARTEGPVVAVGTDTPGLLREHVERAVALVSEPARARAEGDRVVIGPSPDGGFYLLAASRPLGSLLKGVRWCRRTTLGHLRRLLEEAGLTVALLEPLSDLDRRTDLEGWLAHPPAPGGWGPTRRLGAVIARALAALRRPPAPTVLGRPRLAPVLARRGRAPPSHR